MYSGREYWMGLSRDVTYDTVWGGWTWTDGSTLDWDNWDKSEPSNDYGCVYMESKDGEWKEDKCDQNLYCMCEVKSKFTAYHTSFLHYTVYAAKVPRHCTISCWFFFTKYQISGIFLCLFFFRTIKCTGNVYTLPPLIVLSLGTMLPMYLGPILYQRLLHFVADHMRLM